MASTAFRPDLDFDAKIQRFLEMGCKNLGMQDAFLGRVDGDLFRIEHVFTPDLKIPLDFSCNVEDTLCREMFLGCSPLAIEDMGASEYRNRATYLKFRPESYIGAIVTVSGQKYGALSFLGLSSREVPFTEADKEYVRLMALWVGSELERHAIVQELEARIDERSQLLKSIADRDRLLREIGVAIRTSINPSEIESKATSLLGEALHADRCFFIHFDFERDAMRFGDGWRRPDLESIAGETKPSSFGIDIANMFQPGNTVVLDDIAASGWPGDSIERLKGLQIQSAIEVPMFRDDELEALLCVASDQPRKWKEDEIALAEAVAVQTRGAIEAASVIQRERRIATTLQEALLPPLPPRLPGMDLDYAYRAALDESSVGGDFYAAYPVDSTRYLVAIGDVSGKGLTAASNVAALQNILRYAVYAARTLAEAVTQMNAVVIAHNLLTGFATMLVGIYDPQKCTLTYCSCGHEPALIFADDVVKQLETTGPPLGAAEGAVYQERSLQLAAGDVIVMYTDGISEAGPDRRTLLGTQGLIEIAGRRIREAEQTSTASEIVQDALNFSNGRLRDDSCVIVARVNSNVETEPKTVEALVPSPPKEPLPASERLRDTPAEEQFRLLVDNVSEYAIFLLDVNGHIVTWNRGAERLKGYSAPEIIGKHFSIFYTPEDVQRGHPLDELEIAKAEGRYEEEGWRIRKDGTRFWANVVITALWDRSGRLCGFGKVTRDFSERRRVEQQLRRSEERFRLLVQGVRDYAIFMLDPDGRIASWNEGAERLKGYKAHEIIGEHFSKFYTAADIARNHPAFELKTAAEEGRYEEEGWRIRKDGSRFWANVLITALRDENGNLYGYAKVTRDFTERRAAEDARLQSMRDEISRSFLRDILYSVTEGRLRYCSDSGDLPDTLPRLIASGPLQSESLTSLRTQITDLAASMGFDEHRMADLITAASEAGMNAVVHATQAQYAIHADKSTIQVWINDRGSDIELTKLHRATLERGYTTENSLGHGFWLMLHTCDRLWLNSTSSGTTVVLEQDIMAPEPEWLTRPRKVTDYVDAATTTE